MAADKTTKILEVVVDNNKAVSAMAEYNRLIDEQKAKQAALGKQLKDGAISQDDYYKAMAQSKEMTKTYSRAVQELSKEVQNNIKADTEKAGSLRAMRAELSNVTKAYDSLSEADRKTADGLKLKQRIQVLSAELKNTEADTNRFYRNVGNYANGFVEAFTRMGGSMGKLQGPMGLVKNGFTAISSTPIITILGALVSVIQKVIQSFKSSEATMQAVSAAMAPLNAAGRVMQVVMQKIGEGVAKVVTKLSEWADKLGLISDAMKAEQELTKAQIALELREREVLMQNADSQLKVSELRAKAADKSTYSAKERVAFLEEALAEEETIAKREMEIAQERYRILEEESKLAANSKEDNDALAQSYAAMRQAEQSYFDKSRELTAQLVEAKKQIATESKAAGDAAVKHAEAELKAAAVAAGLSEKDIEKALDIKKREVEARLKLVEEGSLEEYNLQQQLLQAQFDQDMQRLKSEEGTDELIRLRREEFHQQMDELDRQWDESAQQAADEVLQANLDRIMQEQQAYLEAQEEEKRIKEARIQMAQDTVSAFGSVVSSVGNMLAAFGKENKELAQLSKVIALAQIAIETGVATAKGISSAMSVPFPANLAAIATTIATIMAGITSAVSTVKSAKFASGGLVTGPGTGTSDSIPARLSNGESVMTARTTSMFGPLLSSLNQAGGGVAFTPDGAGSRDGYEFLAAAVAAGMKSADIRVAVDDINAAQDNVNYIKAVSSIGG
jgi:hypothetical protein